MKILVVDDEPLARARLVNLLKKIPDCKRVDEAENGFIALEKTTRLQPDIILLDIEMPGIDGIETASQLQLKEHPPAIIFTTAYDQHALDAFQSGGQAYLLKPVNAKQLAETIVRAKKLTRLQFQQDLLLDATPSKNSLSPENSPSIHSARKYISVTNRGSLIRIPLEDIYYFKAEQKYVVIYHTGGEALIVEPLKSLQKEFEAQFIRTHRNALVARNKITELRRNSKRSYQVYLKEIAQQLEVSRRHVSSVRKLLQSKGSEIN